MPSRDPAIRFGDIIDNVERVRTYIAGLDWSGFAADTRTQDAVAQCVLRISEAASKLGPEAERQVPEQPWGRIRGIGNILRHDYDQVELPIIWKIASEDLPSLGAAIRAAGYD